MQSRRAACVAIGPGLCFEDTDLFRLYCEIAELLNFGSRLQTATWAVLALVADFGNFADRRIEWQLFSCFDGQYFQDSDIGQQILRQTVPLFQKLRQR